jgi:hypothetical protein
MGSSHTHEPTRARLTLGDTIAIGGNLYRIVWRETEPGHDLDYLGPYNDTVDTYSATVRCHFCGQPTTKPTKRDIPDAAWGAYPLTVYTCTQHAHMGQPLPQH